MSIKTEKEALIGLLKSLISEEMEIDVSEIDENSRFEELGLDSISGIFILDKLEQKYGLELSPALMFDYPTIEKFSEYLISETDRNG